MRRALPGYVFAGLFALSQAGASSWTFSPSWDAYLGPAQEGSLYRSAVCGDGSLYLTDAQGRVTLLNAAGQVIARASGRTEARGIAVACDVNLNLALVSSGQLSAFRPDGNGGLQLIHSIPLDGIRPTVLNPGPGLTFFMLGSSDSGTEFLHVIDGQGRRLRSSGALPLQPTASLSLSAAMNGSLTWNRQTQQLLFLPESPYEFQIYSSSGALMKRVTRSDAQFRGMALDAASQPVPGDRVLRAACLPNGDVVVQIIKRTVDAAGVLRTSSYIELLDSDLRLKGTGIPVAGYGQLQGSADDGSLYFSRISTAQGIHVMKATLSTQQASTEVDAAR